MLLEIDISKAVTGFQRYVNHLKNQHKPSKIKIVGKLMLKLCNNVFNYSKIVFKIQSYNKLTRS